MPNNIDVVYDDNLQAAWEALGMIREAVETLAPPGGVQAEDHLPDPEPTTEAAALIHGIMALRDAYEQSQARVTALEAELTALKG